MMRSSPLRLKELFFPLVSVKALVPNAPENAPRELGLDDLDISFEFDLDTTGQIANAGVGIATKNLSADAAEQTSLYQVQIEVYANFEVVGPEHKDALAVYLRKFAGASALIGAAREQIAMMTARGPWGAVMLPMISMDRVVGPPPKKLDQLQPEVKKISKSKKAISKPPASS
jgi:preprotein translocase subunit SecB